MKARARGIDKADRDAKEEYVELDKSTIQILVYVSAEPYFKALPVNFYAIAVHQSYYDRISGALPRELVKLGIASAVHENRLYFVVHEGAQITGYEDVFNIIKEKCRDITNNACNIVGRAPEYAELNIEKHVNLIKRLIYRMIEAWYVAKHGWEATRHSKISLFLPYKREEPNNAIVKKVIERLSNEADAVCKRGATVAECVLAKERLLQIQNLKYITGLKLMFEVTGKGFGLLYADLSTLIYTSYAIDDIVKYVWMKRSDLCNIDKELCEEYDSKASLGTEKHYRSIVSALKDLGFDQTIRLAYRYCGKQYKDLNLKELVFVLLPKLEIEIPTSST